MSTCRVCKKMEEFGGQAMFKYSVRHYAHGSCGIRTWGAEFLNMIAQHELERLPYLALDESGLLPEVERRVKLLKAGYRSRFPRTHA